MHCNMKYQNKIWDVFNLETNLFPCLVDMKFKGVRVDVQKAMSVKAQLQETEKNLLRYK